MNAWRLEYFSSGLSQENSSKDRVLVLSHASAECGLYSFSKLAQPTHEALGGSDLLLVFCLELRHQLLSLDCSESDGESSGPLSGSFSLPSNND